jgi:hypothetical protein
MRAPSERLGQALLLAMWLSACARTSSKAEAFDAGEPSGSPRARAEGTVRPVDASAGPQAWQGSYEATATTLHLPSELKPGAWKPTDTTTGLGEGELRLTIEADGRVRGQVSGPLGPAIINGSMSRDRLTANITPDGASEQGFAGVLDAVISGHGANGHLYASPRLASAARIATFTLSRTDARP